jgi:hypothetical protein
LWGIKKAKIRQKMSEDNSKGMLAENPLELEMIFAEGVFVVDRELPQEEKPKPPVQEPAGKTEKKAEEVTEIPEVQVAPVEENIVENVPEVIHNGEIQNESAHEQVTEEKVKVSEEQAVPVISGLSKPVRVLIRFSDGLYEGEEQTRDLIKRFFSIINKNGKVLDENYYEILDVKNRQTLPVNVLLNKAMKIIVFGVVESEVCEGLKQYEVRKIESAAVAQFPALTQVMENAESKQKFALALKKFFGQ